LRARYNRLALAARLGRITPAWENNRLALAREGAHARRIMELC
jgi:hypothetical protein